MTSLLVAPTAHSIAETGRFARASTRLPGPIETEILVVGTGAGGAIAGTELARQGKRVLFIEAGGAFGGKDFRRRSLVWSLQNIYAGGGLQMSIGDPPVLIPAGRCVGGSTVLNSGICFRPPDERLQEWVALTGDERLRPDAMRPFVDEIWTRIGIMPTHSGIGRRNNDLLRKGLIALGVEHDWIDRNAPGCVGCGVCHLGCPSGGKASVDRAILPEAVNLGAEILTYARANAILVEGGRAKGVTTIVTDEEGRTRELTIRADRVLVAGSALGTPLLLENSDVGGAERGRHLAIHPAGAAVGEFSDPVVMWDGVPQGYWGRDLEDPRVIVESANVGAGELHALLGGAGLEGAATALRYKNFAMSGGMLRDTPSGTVTRDDDGSPKIRYSLPRTDIEGLKSGIKTATRAYFAAGALRVAPLIHPVTFYDDEARALDAISRVQKGSDFAHVHASHPQGSCRMGPLAGAHAGVVDGNGQVHGVADLFIVDGSIFPSTLGVNPQVTIMALSLALSRRMA
jgi:choline dehydrogenase-like flavoprotein